MKSFRIFLTIGVLSLLSVCGAYRILAVFPFNGKSHNIVLEAIAKTLANRGHQVDVITHFPQKKPIKNYNEIINLDGSLDRLVNNYTIEFVSGLTGDIPRVVASLYGNRVCELMALDEFQKLIKNPPQDPPYDLVIVEAFAANCYFGFGHLLKVPVIAVSSAVEYPWVSYFTGNVDNLAIVPNAFEVGVGAMNFWQRLHNFYSNFMALRTFHQVTEQFQTEVMRKYLSPDIPGIREVEKSVALTLVNTHPAMFGVKPMTPALVQIAGLHVEANDETLPQDLKKWMDESKHGVVYFTFGSMVLIETMSHEQLKHLYKVFNKISPIRVLLKIVEKSKLPPGLPKNVLTLPWIPQQPVLAHPNMKVFITHGGLGGAIEALYYGVPMIGVPLFSDQFRNTEAFIPKGMMLRIDFDKLSEETLGSALTAMLNDPEYKKNAVHHSKLFRDRPMSASESTVYWVEYIIRNGGNVLRSPALEFTWWQLDLLDVYGFVLLFLVSVLVIIALIFKKVLKLLSKKSIPTKKKTK